MAEGNFTMSTSLSDLDTKAYNLVDNYRSVDTLHPTVSELCQVLEFKQVFWDSLNHEFHVICQRSQLIAHGEITIIQKAFAILMQKKKDILPAIELYVDEILGLKFVSETERTTTLNAMIQIRQSILGRTSPIHPWAPNESPH